MDIPEYNCGVRQEENKNDKLTNSYLIGVDSGFDSIYNGCTSMLMEKSFSRESFDIFSPNSINRTPLKQSSSALKYHISTPKNSATIKRHLYRSFNTSSLKRSRSENNENEPKTGVNTSIRFKPDHFNDSACPFKGLHNYDFSPRKNILSSTTNHQLSFINDSALSISKNLTRCEEEHIEQAVPERPSKCLRYVPPLVKHSKRKLDIPPPVWNKEPGRINFHGTQILNIIEKLQQYDPPVLDYLFKRLSSKDLLNISLVSKNWNSIVKSNRNANNRIHQYLNESRKFKENLKEPTKPAITHNNRHPFSQFNILTTSNKTEDSSLSSSFFENQNVVQQLCKNERLVKCPRCSRMSILCDSLARLHSILLIFVPKTTTSDLTFVNRKANSICDKKDSGNKIDGELPQTSENIGGCTSVSCGYIFCTKCLCDYHPGKNCIPSKPESPSKLITCHNKLKIENKSNSKLSSKRQALKRLCFS